MTLDLLNTYQAKDFGQWLDQRLRDLYSGDPVKSYRAFDLREFGVPITDYHIDDIVVLFSRLMPATKEAFRDAIERQIRSSPPNAFPPQAMSDLISLAGRTESFQAMRAFPAVLGSGPWGQNEPDLIYDALSVIRPFEQTADAYIVTKELATSQHFSDFLSYDAYITLIRSRPQNWALDFALLRDRFFRNRSVIAKLEDQSEEAQLARAEQDVANAIAASVPFHDLDQNVGHLRLYSSPGEPNDVWLMERMFARRDPLYIEYSDVSPNVVIVDAKNKARRVTLSSADEFEVYCIRKCYITSTPLADSNIHDLSSHGVSLRNIMSKPLSRAVGME